MARGLDPTGKYRMSASETKDVAQPAAPIHVWHMFLAKVAGTLGTRGLLLLLALTSSVITSRYLGAHGRGVYAVLIAVSSLGVQLGNFGLHAANTFFLGQDRSLRGQIVSNS